MEKLLKKTSSFYILAVLFLASCAQIETGGGFTTGTIGIIITGIFVLVVLFYFLFRKQSKRKGDDNRKP